MFIIFFFLIFLTLPIIVAMIERAIMMNARKAGITKPGPYFLFGYSFLFAMIGVIGSLILTFMAMERYEARTGYCAGNGPVAWIFVYGPFSAVLGQFIALAWWHRKAKIFKKSITANSNGANSPDDKQKTTTT